MQPSHRDGKKDGGASFFQALRRLGRKIDEGVKDAHEQLDARQLSSETNKHVALQAMLDRRKEVETMKVSSRKMLNEMRERGKSFEQNLEACNEVSDLLLQQLSSIQAHLTQYGFVNKTEESTEQGEAGDEAQASEPGIGKDSELPSTPLQDKDSKGEEEAEKRSKLTPRLEDFGVSSFTLNMLNRMAQPEASFKVPRAANPPGLQTKSERHDSVPEMFQNEGLTVTPSLFPRPYGAAEDRLTRAREKYRADQSPEMANQGGLDPSELNRVDDLAKMLDFSDSPVPPVLRTAGIRQIPRGGEQQSGPAPSVGLGNRQTHATEQDSMDSPIPPVLSTPGIKQINKTTQGTYKAGQKPTQSSNPLEMPRTPELTYSLKDLEDMTVSFKQTELSSTFSERSTTTSDLEVSASTQWTTAQQGQAGPPPPHASENSSRHVTSPKLSDLTSQGMLSSLTVSEPPQLSAWSKGRGGMHSLDLPPSPELTMNYSSLSRAVPTTTLSSTATFPSSQRQNAHGQGHNDRYVTQSHRTAENCQRKDQSYVRNKADLSHATTVHSFKTRPPLNTMNEQYEKGPGFLDESYIPSAKSGFGSAYPSERVNCLSDPQGPCSGESTKAREPVLKSPALPDQPLLRHPLTHNGLDLPPTPKFLGSYHFMGSKHH